MLMLTICIIRHDISCFPPPPSPTPPLWHIKFPSICFPCQYLSVPLSSICVYSHLKPLIMCSFPRCGCSSSYFKSLKDSSFYISYISETFTPSVPSFLPSVRAHSLLLPPAAWNRGLLCQVPFDQPLSGSSSNCMDISSLPSSPHVISLFIITVLEMHHHHHHQNDHTSWYTSLPAFPPSCFPLLFLYISHIPP